MALKTDNKKDFKTLRKMQALRAKFDPYYFLTEMCVTFDPHDKQNPYKKFPPLEYIEVYSEIFKEEDKILLEKSRQMMFSWMNCALILNDVLFGQSRYWFLVSKKEDDADKLIERIDFMYQRLPKEFQEDGYKRVYCNIRIPSNRGVIQAVSQNSDALRSHVASGVFVDESEFQDNFKPLYEAIRPTIDGGGKLIAGSTVNGKGPVFQLMNDERDW